MERVHFSHSSETRPATRSPSAETEQGFSAALQSSVGQSTTENELLQRERVALDGLVRDLSGEIQRMRAQFTGLQAAAGRAEFAHQGQINRLLTEIASLSVTIDLAQARNSPEYRRAVGTMQSLYNSLADHRTLGDRSGAATGEALAGLQSREGAIQAALAQILQQLSALQMRMGALGALI